MSRKTILWVGDAGVDSGFGKATHYILKGLDYRYDGEHNCVVIGINYLGDPDPEGGQPSKYPMYSAWSGKDWAGIGRLEDVCIRHRPDVVVLQNDPWNIPDYMSVLREAKIPVVAVLAVDGLNCRGGDVEATLPEAFSSDAYPKFLRARGLNDLKLCVFWTEFGRDQAVRGGYAGPTAVIPLGVDLDIYKPWQRQKSREELNLPIPKDAFLIGNVNRNQPRKRMDLTLMYFADWLRKYPHSDAYLFLHVAPTGESAYDLDQLVGYLGLTGRVLLSQPEPRHGLPEEALSKLYSAFDVLINTSQGEGFHLPSIEAMACGTPVMCSDWAGPAEWARDAALLIPCTTLACTFNGINVIGGVLDHDNFIENLESLYRNPRVRDEYRRKGLARAQERRFTWKEISKQYDQVLKATLWSKPELEVVRG